MLREVGSGKGKGGGVTKRKKVNFKGWREVEGLSGKGKGQGQGLKRKGKVGIHEWKRKKNIKRRRVGYK